MCDKMNKYHNKSGCSNILRTQKINAKRPRDKTTKETFLYDESYVYNQTTETTTTTK